MNPNGPTVDAAWMLAYTDLGKSEPMKAKLTKRTVDAVRVAASDVLVWDSELRGFGMKVTPQNRRVFVAQYWAPQLHRTRRRVTLGAYGALTVDDARAAAQRILGRVANGEDPAAELASGRRAARDETVATVAAVYLEEMALKLKPRTAAEYRRVFNAYIVPALGRKPVAQLSSREIAALHLSHRGTPYQANRTLQDLSVFLNWCEARGFRVRGMNPCRDITRFPERSRERFLSVQEVGRLGSALDTAERTGLPPAPGHRKRASHARFAKHRPRSANTPIPANPFAVAAVRFLLLSGWREQEALTLRWEAVDLAAGVASLEDTKTGRSRRPLGTAAQALLTELPRVEGSPFVFPSPTKAGAPLRELGRVWCAARHAAGLDDVRLHDLRHTVASFAVGSGHSLYVTGKLLGHADQRSTARYAHIADDARKAAADAVSGELAAALSGRTAPRVLPIGHRRAAS
jgi:integrase